MSPVVKLHQTQALAIPRYEDWAEGDLRKELAKRLGLTAENLIHAAAIWSALEKKGYDLSGLKDGFTFYLPRIAAGTVLPELVVAFARTPQLLRKLAMLVPEQQRRMVDGEPIAFVERPGELRMLPVRSLTYRQVTQVFGDGTIRSEHEQIAYISQPPPLVKPGRPVKRGKVTVNPVGATLTIGRASAPIHDVLKALKAAGVKLD